MKEFIDKLIERLEKAKESAKRRNAFDSEVSYACAIYIVNKLAEEYKIFGNSEQVKVSEMPTGWIPCSERLPHEGIKVLCCINPSIAKHEIILAPYEKYVNAWHNGNIIAWMPLPAPYTEGE